MSPIRIGPSNFCAGAYVDIVASSRCNLFLNAAQTYDDAVSNSAIVTKFSVTADDDAAKMVDDKVATYLNFAWQLDTREYLNKLVLDMIKK